MQHGSLLRALLLVLTAAPLTAQGYLCAEGGGSPTAAGWGASVFGWMVDVSNGGDVVVLGVQGSDPAAEAAFLGAGAASATSLAVNGGNADTQAVYDAIVAADVVWMRGGDQWQYVSLWRGTLTEQAIRDVYLAGGVVGGTSAGCAVLGEVIYDARNGGVYPFETLEDPYNVFTTFTDDFLGLGTGLLFDTHFTERGRIGRLPVMVARQWVDEGRDLIGVGVDDRTALCVSPDGTAEVRGEGAVTLLRRTGRTWIELEPGQAPRISELAHDQFTEGYRVDLASGTVLARPAGATLLPPPTGDPAFQDTLLSGASANHPVRGEQRFEDGGDPLALFEGSMEVVAGAGLLTGTTVSTRVWDSFDFDENRTGGAQLVLAEHPHFLALMLDRNVRMAASATGYLTVTDPSGPERSALVLDSHGAVSVAASTYLSSPSSAGPRQSVAIEGARLALLVRGETWSAGEHAVLAPVPYGEGKTSSLGLRPLLGWRGTPSLEVQGLGLGGFALELEDGVPGQPALLFHGSGTAGTPFQGGTLLVAPPIVRDGVVIQDASGRASYPVAIDPGLVGSTRWYQVWLRDPALGGPHPIGLSSALEVAFRP